MCSRSTSNVWSRTVSDAVRLDPIEDAIAAIRRGELVLVVDDEDRENEGDFIFAAELSTPELMAFAVRYSTGVICAPMVGEDLDRLQIPPMTALNQDQKGTAYTVSVDAVAVESTGISAADRSITVRTLADPTSTASDFTRPGHVFPLRAERRGRVLALATSSRREAASITSRSAAHARWTVTGERGTVVVELLMSPDPDPRIQQLTYTAGI